MTHYADPLATLYLGDCLEVMPTLPAESVDAVVTDPPYGLGFMGKHWDHGVPNVDFWREMHRVAKPGAYLLAFGGTRTVHRIATNIEDAGWIIRDMLMWIYASGFPKGKANLKPAHEPIVLARKPGPLRPLAIDECRIDWRDPLDAAAAAVGYADSRARGTHVQSVSIGKESRDGTNRYNPDAFPGRWPSNVLLSDPELFDEPNPEVVGSGATTTSGELGPQHRRSVPRLGNVYNGDPGNAEIAPRQYGGDSGGYSRFFTYSVRMGVCQFCGVPNAESSSSDTTTPAIPDDSTPETVRTNGSDGTGIPAQSAASGSSDSITPTAPLHARLWDDEGSASSSEHPSTSERESGSSSSAAPTMKPTPRSKRPATSPRSASPSDPVTSAEVPATSSGTTRTTRSRWTCDACVALVTQGFTPAEMSTGPEGFPEVPASRPNYPKALIIPKADRGERERGLANPVEREQNGSPVRNARCLRCGKVQFAAADRRCVCAEPNWIASSQRANSHPTVKPIDLMRHLVRLVTPSGGTVLDPFLGSGTTALAASEEGFHCIGIEREAEYLEIAKGRLMATPMGLGLDVA